jgi:hypothetical protein
MIAQCRKQDRIKYYLQKNHGDFFHGSSNVFLFVFELGAPYVIVFLENVGIEVCQGTVVSMIAVMFG